MNKALFRKRKAQVTAFIIAGIVIVAIVAAAYFLTNYFGKKGIETGVQEQQAIELESVRIKNNIDVCVQTLADEGMGVMALQGFYLDIPAGYKYGDSAYWLKDTVNVMPGSFEKIEQDLEDYMDSNIQSCVNFEQFSLEGWDVAGFEPVTNVDIYEDDIGVKLIYTITASKEDFEREFSDSVYVPSIRLRNVYEKSAHLMNNQLLKPDFNINDPFSGYDKEGYVMSAESSGDGKTLVFSISDPESKLLKGRPFTLRFAASFDTNRNPRTYEAGSQTLFSPDRLGVLVFPSGSPIDITIRNYEKDSVTRRQTPHVKHKGVVTERVDTTFTTRYPIYSFSPSGAKFSSPGFFTIFLNHDQRSGSNDVGLLHNGADGWIPFPHVKGPGTISTMVYGFSEFAAMECGEQSEEEHSVGDEFERSWYQVLPKWLSIVILVLAVILAVFTGGGSMFFWGAGQFSAASLPSLAESIVIAGTAYVAYGSFADFEEDESLEITAKCNDDMSVAVEEDNGKCECTIVKIDADAKPDHLKDGETYSVEGGITYKVLATAKEFDDWKTKMTCKCTVSGMITTNRGDGMECGSEELLATCDESLDECDENLCERCAADMEGAPGSWHCSTERLNNCVAINSCKDAAENASTRTDLVCCFTKDGYCLDNFMAGKCDGITFYKSCSEIPECEGRDRSKIFGTLQLIPQYGREGSQVTALYHITTADSGTAITLHLKSAGADIGSIQLHDDGQHNDENAADKKYANLWIIPAGILGDTTSKQVSFDVSINYGAQTVRHENAGSMIVLGSQDCVPLLWGTNATLDIEIIGNNYGNATKYSQDADSVTGKMVVKDPFKSMLLSNNINFYKIGNAAAGTDQELKTYADEQCDYNNAPTNFKIILDDAAVQCTQQDNVARLNPLFTLKDEAEDAILDDIVGDFCSYINNLVLLKPPVPIILTENVITEPGNVTVNFKVSDEEYPVYYKVIFNSIEVTDKLEAPDDSVQEYVLPLRFYSAGNYTVRIKATDQQGISATSDELSIALTESS